MKRFIFLLISIICIISILSSCGDETVGIYRYSDNIKNLDSLYKVTPVYKIDSKGVKHDYYLYETGYKYQSNYSFSVEHRMDCKACLDIFD